MPRASATRKVLRTSTVSTDPLIVAGQGTIGLELTEQCPYLDMVVIPVGGGGLAAGIAIAMKTVNPRVHIVGVQSEDVPSMKVALAQQSQ